MLPLALLGLAVAAFYLATRSSTPTNETSSGGSGKSPGDFESEFKKYLIPSDAPTSGRTTPGGGASERLFGPSETDLPLDPSVLFGLPFDPTKMFFEPVTGDMLSIPDLMSSARGATKVALPKDERFADAGADAYDAKVDDRVLVFVTGEDSSRVGVMEGLYYGPTSNYDTDSATVTVDRIAEVGSGDLAYGRYVIPPSKRRYEQTYVSRVVWTPVDPSSLDLVAVIDPPKLGKGDKLTLVAHDTVGNNVVWIGQVHEARSDGSYDVILQKAYKVLRDVGVGKISPPFNLAQALVNLQPSQLVNPKSIPT